MESQTAKAQSKAGLTCELQVHCDQHLSDPSRGGSHGYMLYQWEEVLNLIHQHGSVDAAIEDGGACPSQVTMYRWIDHIEPYQMTRNHQLEDLTEEDQLLLAIFYYVWPDASAKEASCFIFNNNGGLQLYLPQAIRKQLAHMDITRKGSSTEAHQVFSPQNQLKLHLFFIQRPPLGVNGVDQCHLTDIDEFGISVERTNKKYGYTHASLWV